MPPMAAISVGRSMTRRPSKKPEASKLKSISIDMDDSGSGGTVTCSYSGDESVPFGGENKRHSFESAESILGFVKAKLLGEAEGKATTKADEKPAEGSADEEAGESDDEEAAEGDE